MPPTDQPGDAALPRPAAALLRALLPHAERDEVLDDLGAEYAERWREEGRVSAGAWLWSQVLGSVPALLRRGWWRGMSGFEPRANAMRPGGPMFESWIMDLRFAVRRLRTRPKYTVLATLTLALGIGGTAAIYGVVRELLLEPLPYRAEQEVGVFWYGGSWNEQEIIHLRPQVTGFSSLAGYRPDDATLQTGDGPARLVPGVSTSAELFDVLGVRPMIGPGFKEGDDRLGTATGPTVVLSHGLWRDLGSDPSIIGKRLMLDGLDRTVVGVMPPGFWFPDPSVRVWMAAGMNPENRSGRYTLIGRVAPGERVEAMERHLAGLVAVLQERFDYPEQWDPTKNPGITPVRESLLGSVRPALLATVAAMFTILLIACSNVAALMLAQVNVRTTELAVRSALGADRRRLTWQLVAESLVLGLLAGLMGALLAVAGVRLLATALPLGAWGEAASPDWRVFAAAMLLAVLASVLIACFPVFSLWRGDLRDMIGRARTGGVGGRGGRLEHGLVVAEVALAVVLAAGATLLVRSVGKLNDIDAGIATEGVAVAHVAAGAGTTSAQRRQAVLELTDALARIPGVRSVGAANKIPLTGSGDNWGIQIVGRDESELPSQTTAFRIVTRDYFDALGMSLKKGRLFEPSDRQGAERVVVINEELARVFFEGEDPIGRYLQTGFDTPERIVGIVGTVAEADLTDEPQPARYMLYDQLPYTGETNSFVVRVAPGRDADALLEQVRRTINATVPTVAVQDLTTMERVFQAALGPVRQVMSLLTLLTALALVLGAIGVYGVMSHFASRRQRDWGIQIALGLLPSRVVGRVLRHGAVLVGTGLAIGLVAVLGLRRVVGSLLYGVEATDPLSILLAMGALVAVGFVAAWLPARRASRTDPAIVLREQ